MAQPWLPDACLTDHRAAQPMAQIVLAWAKDWFVSSPWQVLGNWDEVTSSQDELASKTLGRASGIEITGTAKSEIALGLAVLKAKEHTSLTSDDEDLLTKLGARAIADLADRISQSSQLEVKTNDAQISGVFSKTYSLLIGQPGDTQIALECSMAQLVTMTRATYPKLLEPAVSTPVAELIAELSVKVSARIGTAQITLRDLAELEVGDLLLLDKGPGDFATLVIEEETSSLAFTISEADDSYLLEYQEET